MKHHPIEYAFKELPPGIKNTAAHYPEGRNVLVYCLARGAKRTEGEVVKWLDEEGIQVYKLHEYRIRDDSD
jgi:hypothetical protein